MNDDNKPDLPPLDFAKKPGHDGPHFALRNPRYMCDRDENGVCRHCGKSKEDDQ